jgi:sterol 3beta-glucosyltransferase
MKITICTIGSRGDVQPFLILGEYLARSGHRVKVCSAALYTSLAKDYDVEYVPFPGDYSSLVYSDAMKKVLGRNPFRIRKRLKEQVFPVIESSLDTFFELSKWADLVLYHPKTLVDSFGYLFPEKLIKAYVVPLITPTRAFASPVLSFLSLPWFLNKLSFRISNMLYSTVKTPVRNFSRRHDLNERFRLQPTPVIYGISPAFLPKPRDYPEDHCYTGFWFESRHSERLEGGILSFLDTEVKKLVITFGSMPYTSRIPIDTFITALIEKVRVNIVVVKGWGLRNQCIRQNKHVLVVDTVPFHGLFPLADAVLHHGGAGTTAAALRSGLPMMITPVLYPFGDQLFWGKRVHELGLGVKPVPLKRLKVKNFVDSVAELLNNDYSENTALIQKMLSTENGLKKSLEIIESLKVREGIR